LTISSSNFLFSRINEINSSQSENYEQQNLFQSNFIPFSFGIVILIFLCILLAHLYRNRCSRHRYSRKGLGYQKPNLLQNLKHDQQLMHLTNHDEHNHHHHHHMIPYIQTLPWRNSSFNEVVTLQEESIYQSDLEVASSNNNNNNNNRDDDIVDNNDTFNRNRSPTLSSFDEYSLDESSSSTISNGTSSSISVSIHYLT
jgi:hypothetical protein